MFTAFTRYFSLKVPASGKVLASACKNFESYMFTSKLCVDFAMQTLSKLLVDYNATWSYFCVMLHAFKCFAWKYLRNIYMWSFNFQSWFRDAAHLISHMKMGFKVFCMTMPNTWAYSGPLKVKYFVNDVSFKHI